MRSGNAACSMPRASAGRRRRPSRRRGRSAGDQRRRPTLAASSSPGRPGAPRWPGFRAGRRDGGRSPLDWARTAVRLYESLDADCIVAEVNQGGELVAQMLRQVSPGCRCAWCARRAANSLRAEPVAALYERGLVAHVGLWPSWRIRCAISAGRTVERREPRQARRAGLGDERADDRPGDALPAAAGADALTPWLRSPPRGRSRSPYTPRTERTLMFQLLRRKEVAAGRNQEVGRRPGDRVQELWAHRLEPAGHGVADAGRVHRQPGRLPLGQAAPRRRRRCR